MKMERRTLLAGLVGVGATGFVTGCSTTETSRTDLDTRARAALASLYATVPPAKDVANRSKAYLVFPGITQGSFIFGGQFGNGVLYKGGKPAGFYTVAGGSFGLQAGAQSFSQGIFFTTDAALRTFEETKGLQLGAGVDFAVATTGTTGQINTTNLQKPVIVFVWGQSGLVAGVNVSGQKITELTSN